MINSKAKQQTNRSKMSNINTLVPNWLSIKYNFSFSIRIVVLLFMASELLVTDAFMLKTKPKKRTAIKITIKQEKYYREREN